MKKIGSVNGRTVTYNETSGTVRVYGTEVTIFNVKNEEMAIQAAKRNLKNFKESL